MPRPWAWEQARQQRFDPGLDDVMAAKGRDRSVSGAYRTRPGASIAPQDTSITGERLKTPALGGRTAGAAWNSFFASAQAATAARRTMPSLIPEVSIDAPAMAQEWNGLSSSLTGLSKPPPIDAYLSAGVDASTQFFNRRAQSIAPMAGSVAAGTSFSSRYGSGSVKTAQESMRDILAKYPLPVLNLMEDL